MLQLLHSLPRRFVGASASLGKAIAVEIGSMLLLPVPFCGFVPVSYTIWCGLCYADLYAGPNQPSLQQLVRESSSDVQEI